MKLTGIMLAFGCAFMMACGSCATDTVEEVSEEMKEEISTLKEKEAELEEAMNELNELMSK